VGHVTVDVSLRGKKKILLRSVLVDTGASFTVLSLRIAEEYLIETPFDADLRLRDGRRVKAKVFICEAEIEDRRGVDPTTGRLEKTEFYMLYILEIRGLASSDNR